MRAFAQAWYGCRMSTQLFPRHAYINLTTFRKNGTPVPTPVWFVEADGRLYVFTQMDSGKVKRIRANGRAQVAASDVRGRPLTAFLPASARLIGEGDPQYARILERYKRKYGLQWQLFALLARLRGQRKPMVMIDLEPLPQAEVV